MTTVVEIEGCYENGHEYHRIVEVRDQDDLELTEDWWWDVVHPETGDGQFSKQGSCTTAKILNAPDKRLVGNDYEWVD